MADQGFALSKKEARLIKRCCVLPCLARVSLIMVFGVWLLMGVLLFIHDMAFYGEGDLGMLGPYTAGAFTAVFIVVLTYSVIATKVVMSGKRWRALEEKVRVQQTRTDHVGELAAAAGLAIAGSSLRHSDNDTASTVGDVATVVGGVAASAAMAKVMDEYAGDAESVARVCGIKPPNTKRLTIVTIVVPILIMLAVYAATYVSAANAMEASQAKATAQSEILGRALEGICTSVEGADGPDSYEEYGYSVYGFLSGSNRDYRLSSEPERSIQVNLDTRGLVEEAWYTYTIDPDLSFEENLAQAKADFAKLGRALEGSGAEAEVDAVLSNYEIPDEFCEKFLATDIYTEVSSHEDRGDYTINCLFITSTQANFDEDTHPYIQLFVDSDL